MPKRGRNKPKRKPSNVPVTSLTQQAREQFIQADLLGLQASRSRTVEATRGAFSARVLRSGGASFGNYMLGGPPPKPPSRPKSRPKMSDPRKGRRNKRR